MASHTPYSRQFYDHHRAGARRSAEAVIALLREMGVPAPERVLDVGCGQGAWLDAFAAAGATSLTGLDGGWNSEHFLERSDVRFVPIELDRTSAPELLEAAKPPFDVAVCVEVVEHLPDRAGAAIVEALAASAPIVVFSAAIPGQGGTEHQNEQWPSHWADYFASYGFVPFDLVRPRVWNDSRVDPWYRQNLLIFARPDTFDQTLVGVPGPLDLVHPYLLTSARETPEPGDWARATPHVARQALRNAASTLRSTWTTGAGRLRRHR